MSERVAVGLVMVALFVIFAGYVLGVLGWPM